MDVGNWIGIIMKNDFRESKMPGHLVDYGDLIGLYQKQGEIKAQLKHTYAKAVAVYNDISSTRCWTGKTKKAMLAYLHLIIQMHGALIGETMEDGDYRVDCDCMEEPRRAFRDAEMNLSSLPELSACLRELEEIQ